MPRPRLRSSKAKVNKLVKLLTGRPRALVLIHDNPDPDAMAGALCVTHLVDSLLSIRSRIVYGGIVGRAENRNMVRALDVPLWTVESIRFQPEDAVIVIDTQPGFANNSLPESVTPVAVIDHHSGSRLRGIPLIDVRPHYGAVASIMTEYLVSAGVRIPGMLATAICYAIGSETQDLGREAAPPDIAAFLEVFPLCDQPLLGSLRHPRHSMSFMAEMDHALRTTAVVDNIAVCHLSFMPAPDTAAEIADMLLAIEGVDWVLCTGIYEDRLIVSLRTSERDARAGELLRRIVGEKNRAGGHGMMAGGSLALEDGADPDPIQERLTGRFLEELGHKPGAALTPLMEVPGVRKSEDLEIRTGDRK